MRPFYRHESFRFAPAAQWHRSIPRARNINLRIALEALLVQDHEHRGHPSLLGNVDDALPRRPTDETDVFGGHDETAGDVEVLGDDRPVRLKHR